VLLSERDELWHAYVAALVHSVVRPTARVAIVVPPAICEEDLLETAAKQRFHFAILVLNNIFYAPYYAARRPTTLASDGIFLVRRMVRLFRVPIIALYGMPDSTLHVATLLETGATAAMKLPFAAEEMKRALRRCLDRAIG
jgi:hypothetical protein